MNDNDFYPYAYSTIGERYYETQPGHYKKKISGIGGLCNQHFMGPFMFQGHCNTEVFEHYLEKILLPQLTKEKIVVIDNASFHKSAKIKNSIRKLIRYSTLLLENAMAKEMSFC